ncbi:Asp23/Gls24 family envelope stress response protein [Paenarthrobacter sp. NPDC092416]|uniref:Asp23/Gls24 family envelope stress response protein n=1 Tax=Paenarthrobacter sp. NPDC092416 TaxID=3364386 RepID=UPI0037F95C5A
MEDHNLPFEPADPAYPTPEGELAAEIPGTGRTVISEAAVAKVAGIAARTVPGVYSLGSGPSRALGAIRDAVGSSDHAAGVRAEVGETQVAVDINLVAVYGHPLHGVANQVRAAVYRAVEELVGLQVIEVNIEINDVYVAPPAKTAGPKTALAEREPLQ